MSHNPVDISQNKQWWLVSEYYQPCENATGQIMTAIAAHLSKANRVNVLTTTQGENTSAPEEANLKVFRIRDSKLDKNSLFQRLLRIVLLSLRLFFAILRHVKRGDTLISVTNPTVLTFLLRFGKMIRGFKVVLIVHDVFPENLVATGIIKKSNLFYPLVRWGFNNALNRFDAVLVIGRDMEQLMKQKISDHRKIHYLPNFAETGKIIPLDKNMNPIVREYELNNKLVIFFAGNIGRAQHIDFICMLILRMKKWEDIHFLLMGDGAMKTMLKAFIQDHGLSNTTLLPAMSRSMENTFLNAGDIGLVSLKPGLKGMGVPSKTYSYMASARPVLAMVEPGSEIDLMVREHDMGWCLNPLDIDQCVDTILALKDNPADIKAKGEAARRVCEKYYTPEIYTSKLIGIINSI
jgi:glycosyltransferase involved in cell wall biosynthesis